MFLQPSVVPWGLAWHTNKNAGHSSSQSWSKKVFRTENWSYWAEMDPEAGPEAGAVSCLQTTTSHTWSARNPESRRITHQTIHKLPPSLWPDRRRGHRNHVLLRESQRDHWAGLQEAAEHFCLLQENRRWNHKLWTMSNMVDQRAQNNTGNWANSTVAVAMENNRNIVFIWVIY